MASMHFYKGLPCSKVTQNDLEAHITLGDKLNKDFLAASENNQDFPLNQVLRILIQLSLKELFLDFFASPYLYSSVKVLCKKNQTPIWEIGI